MMEAKIRDLFADIASAPADVGPTDEVLRRVRRRRIRNGSGIILLSVAVAWGAGVGAGVANRVFGDRSAAPVTTAGGDAPTMTSITPEQLGTVCCKSGLRAPSTSEPPVSKAQAEQIALKTFPPGTTIRESVLASAPEHHPGWADAGVVVGDFWIISMWPPNGEFGKSVGDPDGPSFTFALVFIDARTGTWLSRARGR